MVLRSIAAIESLLARAYEETKKRQASCARRLKADKDEDARFSSVARFSLLEPCRGGKHRSSCAAMRATPSSRTNAVKEAHVSANRGSKMRSSSSRFFLCVEAASGDASSRSARSAFGGGAPPGPFAAAAASLASVAWRKVCDLARTSPSNSARQPMTITGRSSSKARASSSASATAPAKTAATRDVAVKSG